MRCRLPRLCLAFLCWCVFVVPALAGAEDPWYADPEQTAGGTAQPWFRLFAHGSSKADVGGRSGEYSTAGFTAMGGYRWFTLAYTRTEYQWSKTASLPFGKGSKPWNTLQKVSLDAATDGMFTERLGWFAGGTLLTGFENELRDSFSLVGRAGLSVELNANLRARIGALWMWAPAHSMGLPLVSLDWGHESDEGFSASVGAPATSLRYRFNPALGLRFTSMWSRDLYRLATRSDVYTRGYVENSGFTSGAYVDLAPLDGLSLTAGAELLSGRKMRLYNDRGDKLNKFSVDDSLGWVLRGSYSF